MPAAAVKGAVVVVSIAVAAAIAVYESPQARQLAIDVRRKIAIALNNLSNEINPEFQQPRYNRPEDAEGFMQSSAEPGVEADEESKRRQREELMYWNAMRLERAEREKAEQAPLADKPDRGSNFEDFLQEDTSADKGTFVYRTGAEPSERGETTLRNRGGAGLGRATTYANPFADEHHIDWDAQHAIDASLVAPDISERFDDAMSDLYNASDAPRRMNESPATLAAEPLIDVSEPAAFPDPPVSYPAPEHIVENRSAELAGLMSSDNSAYASIHAWAEQADQSFYRSLPTTPRALTPTQEQHTPVSPIYSDPPESVPGDLTPTESMSIVDSTENIWGPRSGATSDVDILSVDGNGIATPESWSEVGSVVSDNSAHHQL